MQEEAQSSLSERVESLAVNDEQKTATGEKEEEIKEKPAVKETNKDTEEKRDPEETTTEEEKRSMEAEEHQKSEGATTDAEVNGEGEKEEEKEDWEMPFSVEEQMDTENWTPPPEEIKRLYELLARGEELKLHWIPLPRRSPTPPPEPSPEREGEPEDQGEQERESRSGRDLFKSERVRSAGQAPLSPNSQRERERDSDPSTVFSPKQRRY
ncbi:hypothetical protein DNTS_023164 [Danionella cerebrum]|uniref:PAXIP1-associated glutamate-rich protein 1 n=1 Tax=Danionella cerebrum TaxID=2873325 RepID=A0A553MQW7_9TELE|nr:hypothetical protein DNTS_023164 [Danionella translucida]